MPFDSDAKDEIISADFINYFISHAIEPLEVWSNDPAIPVLKNNDYKIIQFPYSSSPYLKLIFNFAINTIFEEERHLIWIIKPISKKYPNGIFRALK